MCLSLPLPSVSSKIPFLFCGLAFQVFIHGLFPITFLQNFDKLNTANDFLPVSSEYLLESVNSLLKVFN